MRYKLLAISAIVMISTLFFINKNDNKTFSDKDVILNSISEKMPPVVSVTTVYETKNSQVKTQLSPEVIASTEKRKMQKQEMKRVFDEYEKQRREQARNHYREQQYLKMRFEHDKQVKLTNQSQQHQNTDDKKGMM